MQAINNPKGLDNHVNLSRYVMSGDYKRVTPDYGAVYERIEALKNEGIWVCDALDHNEPDGCSNPECWKYKHFVADAEGFGS